MYALIEIAGKQYKVEDGVSIKVPKLEGKIGAKYPIDKVLYIEENGKKIVGMPCVDSMRNIGYAIDCFHA